MWLDNASVARLRDRNDPDVSEALRKLAPIVFPMDPAVRQAEIGCPQCAATMKRVVVPDTIHYIDVCDAHDTWFDRDELSMFVSVFVRQREGEIDDADLAAAGVPGGSRPDGESGFFTDLYRAIQSLLSA